jgi:hypothetical protein
MNNQEIHDAVKVIVAGIPLLGRSPNAMEHAAIVASAALVTNLLQNINTLAEAATVELSYSALESAERAMVDRGNPYPPGL